MISSLKFLINPYFPTYFSDDEEEDENKDEEEDEDNSDEEKDEEQKPELDPADLDSTEGKHIIKFGSDGPTRGGRSSCKRYGVSGSWHS